MSFSTLHLYMVFCEFQLFVTLLKKVEVYIRDSTCR